MTWSADRRPLSRHMTLWLSAGVLLLAPAIGACTHAPRPPVESTHPTFTEDIAPVVFEHCTPCHRPGGAAPFSLLTFEDVRGRARLIANVVARRYMPPWMPEPGHGRFQGERRLSEGQIAAIRAWVDAGTLRGAPDAQPPTPTWTEGWQLGRPDLEVDGFVSYRLPPDGPDHFRTFLVPVPLREARHIRAVEIRPGQPRAVHHAVVRVARGSSVPAESQVLDGGDGMLISEASIASPDGHMIGWAPGYGPTVAPSDMPWTLEPGTALALELHLRPTGKPEDVRPTIGLYFADQPPRRRPFGLQLGSYTIDIPAGATEYSVEDRYVLPVDVQVQAIYPHAHYLGRDLRAWATLPNGTERPLIWIRRWDFNWQNAYRYAEPVDLPRGSTVVMRYVYDNSSANPRNPSQPPKAVRYGGQSTDEMGNLWMQVTTATPSDLDILRADYAVKSAERQVEGYEHLLRQRPDHQGIRRALADAYNFIGVSWRARGRPSESAQALARAIAVLPDHAVAHNNLGSVLRAQGRAREAGQAYRRAIAIDPRFADAHFNLGLLLQGTGDAAGARRHLRQAVALEPGSPQSANALAWVLATDRQATAAERREAATLAERAVTLTARRDSSALDTLAVALAAAGDFDGAIRTGSEALRQAEAAGEGALASDIRGRIALYRTGRAYTP